MLEIKNTVTEMKYTFGGLFSRLDMAEKKNQWAWGEAKTQRSEDHTALK